MGAVAIGAVVSVTYLHNIINKKNYNKFCVIILVFLFMGVCDDRMTMTMVQQRLWLWL
jgi:hypothetical protein